MEMNYWVPRQKVPSALDLQDEEGANRVGDRRGTDWTAALATPSEFSSG